VVVVKASCHDAKLCGLAQMLASLDHVCKTVLNSNDDRLPFVGPEKCIAIL
jgi:hypothetical protein